MNSKLSLEPLLPHVCTSLRTGGCLCSLNEVPLSGRRLQSSYFPVKDKYSIKTSRDKTAQREHPRWSRLSAGLPAKVRSPPFSTIPATAVDTFHPSAHDGALSAEEVIYLDRQVISFCLATDHVLLYVSNRHPTVSALVLFPCSWSRLYLLSSDIAQPDTPTYTYSTIATLHSALQQLTQSSLGQVHAAGSHSCPLQQIQALCWLLPTTPLVACSLSAPECSSVANLHPATLSSHLQTLSAELGAYRMPTLITQAARAAAFAYSAIVGHSTNTGYSRLPPVKTRTSSYGGSNDLGCNSKQGSPWPAAGAESEGGGRRCVKLWCGYKQKLSLCLILLVSVALSVVTLLRRNATTLGPLTLAALSTTCESIPWQENGWFQHPTTYPQEAKSGRRQAHAGYLSLHPSEFQQRTSQACADLWISKGVLCDELILQKEERSVLGDNDIDVAWTFVEPTPFWKKWVATYAKGANDEKHETNGTARTRFQSFDEIRYSIRSVVKNLPFAEKLTLLATSLPASPPPARDMNDTYAFSTGLGCRVAQTPNWLNHDSVKFSPPGNDEIDSRLEILSHWEQFDSRSVDQEETLAWKHSVLPTFNSHSIESQLYNLRSPSETVLYMNNDNYVGRPLAPSDVATRIFGPVFRISPGSWAAGALTIEDAMKTQGQSNARVRRNTFRLVDERFGRRDRNYPAHIASTLPAAMMTEVAKTWGNELKETAGVRFRGRGSEVWLPLLVMYYTIEKQREATLWSFIVAKSDTDASNTYSLGERKDMLASLGGEREGDLLHFKTPGRTWDDTSHKEILRKAGISVPNDTEIYWSAMNGYPYVPGHKRHQVFPKYDGIGKRFCTVSIRECFGREGFFDNDQHPDTEATLNPEELLRRVAFNNIQCGDCLIGALLSQSGKRGFKAFLPEKKDHERPSKINTRNELAVISGWNKQWQDTEFAINKVVPKSWNRRDFAVRLIQRYAYSYGQTPMVFKWVNNDLDWNRHLFSNWSQDKPAFMSLNDRVSTPNMTLLAEIANKF